MSSGVKVDNACVETYTNFKLGKKIAFIVFSFNAAATHIVVEHQQPKGDDTKKNSQWDKLIEMLPANDVRYVVADLDYNLEGPKTDMVFITWGPDTAPIKRKMLLASSQNALKSALVGCNKTIQACGYPDVELKNVVEKFKGTL